MTNFENQEEECYFRWLASMVTDTEEEIEALYPVLLTLFNIEFRYSIELDENRVGDAMTLRNEFRNFYGFSNKSDDIFIKNMSCNVLEVLVALTKRLCESVIGDESVPKWFRIWLGNLGLLDILGRRFDRGLCCVLVEIWMRRDFHPDGSGSPFPLRNPSGDQRKHEIYHQMMDYIAENDPFEGRVVGV